MIKRKILFWEQLENEIQHHCSSNMNMNNQNNSNNENETNDNASNGRNSESKLNSNSFNKPNNNGHEYETDELDLDSRENQNKERNSFACFNINNSVNYSLLLKRKLLYFLEFFSQYENNEITEGNDNLNIEKYMFRKYEKKLPDEYKYNNKKEDIFLVLDNSGSCEYYADMISKTGKIAELLNFVQIYMAPNGVITHKIHKGKEIELSSESCDWSIIPNGSNIIFLGDFDGGDILVEASKKHNIIWLCCEDRYDELNEHSWNSYELKDFNGFIYYVYNEKDIVNAINHFTQKYNIFSTISITKRQTCKNKIRY